MKEIPIVYWSGGGNTAQMSIAIETGINNAGAKGKRIRVQDTTAKEIAKYDAVAFGCPAMGTEQLEGNYFEPFFREMEQYLDGKRVILFGSYGWGGSYMKEWNKRVTIAGGILVDRGFLAENEPDQDALDYCKKMGKALVEASK